MLAKGKDGQWRPLEELSPEEQEKWIKGQNEADEIWERMKYGDLPRHRTLSDVFLSQEQEQRLC